jgi:hypothetical protein
VPPVVGNSRLLLVPLLNNLLDIEEQCFYSEAVRGQKYVVSVSGGYGMDYSGRYPGIQAAAFLFTMETCESMGEERGDANRL